MAATCTGRGRDRVKMPAVIENAMLAPCGMNCKICYKHCFSKKHAGAAWPVTWVSLRTAAPVKSSNVPGLTAWSIAIRAPNFPVSG